MTDLETAYRELMDAYSNFKHLVRCEDKYLFERWKAGGYLVDEDIMSMYPNATDVFEQLNEESSDEDGELDDD